MKSFFPLLIILISICIFSCAKKGKETGAAASVEVEAAEPITLSLNNKEESTNPPPAKTEAAEPSSSPPVRIENPGRNESFYSDRSSDFFPLDFKIGALQDNYSTVNDKKEIIRTVDGFLESLGNGVINEDYIHSEWIGAITRSLKFHLDAGLLPERFRTGIILFSEQTARLNIRLFSKGGRSSGEVFLEKIEGKWLISDFQVPLLKLGEKYKNEEELFMPSVYKYLDGYFNNF